MIGQKCKNNISGRSKRNIPLPIFRNEPVGRNNGYTYLCAIQRAVAQTMLASGKYKKSEASIETAARIAGGSEFNGPNIG
jgi:hypothetical protein